MQHYLRQTLLNEALVVQVKRLRYKRQSSLIALKIAILVANECECETQWLTAVDLPRALHEHARATVHESCIQR